MKTSGYPTNFKNVPIGYHQKTDSTTNFETALHGHIVKMFKVDYSTIPGISYTEEAYRKNPSLYYFDVQNDKEGLCDQSPTDGGGGGGGQGQQGNCCVATPGVGGCTDITAENVVVSYEPSCADDWTQDCVNILLAIGGCQP